MAFTPRLSKPTGKNPYYIRKADGGYSPCIAGKPMDSVLTALANCVGWAVGRFNEIGGYGCCKYLGSTNAENFVNLAKSQGLTVSQKPTLGGCMVWAKGKVGNSADGAGHVAIVESINADGSVITSESGYNSTVWYSKKRLGSNWGQGAAYTYLGCIVNPAVVVDAETKSNASEQNMKEVKAKDSAKSYNKALSGNYTTTANLCIRDGANRSKKVLSVIPKGTNVRCYGYYTKSNGLKWMYVQVTVNNIRYTGFCSEKYLKL